MDNRPDGEKAPGLRALLADKERRIELLESRLKVAEEALEKIAEYADELSSCKVAEQVLDAGKKTKGE